MTTAILATFAAAMSLVRVALLPNIAIYLTAERVWDGCQRDVGYPASKKAHEPAEAIGK